MFCCLGLSRHSLTTRHTETPQPFTSYSRTLVCYISHPDIQRLGFASSGSESKPKEKDKCLQTSLLSEFRSYEDGDTEAGGEFQSLPEKCAGDVG
ncbi:hypothetical protein E2C01_065851 [Portunus trituberculatus]|uniref:Uncharacterized protein n=1 Tax=Portunus trituberculatus TaxID=210409 RepID=A0A5B7HJZ5_PORTR|nr:hypothetical protein [Portunus trituberculatus]